MTVTVMTPGQSAKLAEFERSLTNVPPGDDTVVARFECIRESAKQLAAAIIGTTPMSRHQSLALTALEESTMWAIKSIALNQDDLPEWGSREVTDAEAAGA